jgi:hypothetical protein
MVGLLPPLFSSGLLGGAHRGPLPPDASQQPLGGCATGIRAIGRLDSFAVGFLLSFAQKDYLQMGNQFMLELVLISLFFSSFCFWDFGDYFGC